MAPLQVALLVAFFMPSYETCHQSDLPTSPNSLAELAFGGVSVLTGFAAIYLLIVLDLISTLRSLFRRRATRRNKHWWLLLVPGATMPMLGTMQALEVSKQMGVVALLMSAILLPYHVHRSMRVRGYRSLLHAGVASSLACAPVAFVYVQNWARFGDGFLGAIIHVVATSLLLVIGYGALAIGLATEQGLSRAVAHARERGGARPRVRAPLTRATAKGLGRTPNEEATANDPSLDSRAEHEATEEESVLEPEVERRE